MKPLAAARTAAVPAWCAGMLLIAAGWPLPAAVAAAAACIAAAYAATRWGPGWWAALKVTVQLRRSLRQAAATVKEAGTSVDRV